MTAADAHARHIAHLFANEGRQDPNHRKATRQLRLRNWLYQGRETDQFMLTRTGVASANGMSLYVMDDREPDRATVVLIDSREEAFAIMQLAAEFINARNALDNPAPFHYQSLEVGRLDTGPDSDIHVQFDTRSESVKLWPSCSRHMSLPYPIFKIIQAVMSRI